MALQVATKTDSPETGTLIQGRYELLSKVGTGSFGDVYEAIDRQLDDCKIAVKLLHRTLLTETQDLENYNHQLLELRNCRHQNLVQIFESGALSDPPYLTMELLTGCSLADILAASRRPLKPSVVEEIVYQILSALAAVHKLNIIHRDLKPANIFITADGIVKLIDFGFYSPRSSNSNKLQSEHLVNFEEFGTPAYMSPEQFRAEEASAASDLYSLSVVVFEMLTKSRPFTETKYFSLAEKHLQHVFPSLSCACKKPPPSLQSLVEDCSQKEVSKRPPNAAAALERYLPNHQNLQKDASEIGYLVRQSSGRRTSFYFSLPSIEILTILVASSFIVTMLSFVGFIRYGRSLNSRFSGFVIRQEQDLGVSIPLPKDFLNIERDSSNPAEIFDLLALVADKKSTQQSAGALAWVRSGRAASVRYSGPKLELRGATPLIFLAKEDLRVRDREFRQLLEMNADPNLKDRLHNTALHYAVSSAIESFVRNLMQNGANPFQLNMKGLAPIHLAVLGGNVHILRFLFDALPTERANIELANFPTADGKLPSDLLTVVAPETRAAISSELAKRGAKFRNELPIPERG